MSIRHPIQVLALSASGALLAVAYGSTIQLVDVVTGELKCTSSKEDSHQHGMLIRNLVWWRDEKLISNAEDKVVKEWHVQTDGEKVSLSLKEQRELQKKANVVTISADGQTVIVADKFGDVYAYPLFECTPDLPAPPAPSFPSEPSTSASPADAAPSVSDGLGSKPQRIGKQKHKFAKVGILKDPTNGPQWRHVPARVSAIPPVLGHVSMVTDILLLDDDLSTGKAGRLITADRDEHIRVSRWPKAWQIERFLLGQKKFVSSLTVHPKDRSLLLTAGGDDTLRIWSLDSYECLSKSVSLEPLKGFAQIRVEIPKWGRKGKKRANDGTEHRKANKAAKVGGSESVSKETTPGDVDSGGAELAEDDDEVEIITEPEQGVKIKQLDLAIRKMVWVGFGKDTEHEDSLLVMSGVGSSALLAYRASSLLESSSSQTQPEHQLIKLDYPILDIAALPSKRHLWITLDISTSDKPESTQAVRCFEVSGDGLLVTTNHASLKTLNEDCSGPTTATDPYPKSLLLYPEVSLLSKEIPGGDGEGGVDESMVQPDEGQEAEEAEDTPISKKTKETA